MNPGLKESVRDWFKEEKLIVIGWVGTNLVALIINLVVFVLGLILGVRWC